MHGKAQWLKAAAILGLLGATVGAGLDGIHTHTDTTSYPDPLVWRMAWWVPLLFASAGIAIGLARPLWERVLDRRTPSPAIPFVALGMGIFMLSYFLSGVLPLSWPMRAMVLAALFAISWSVCDRSALGMFLAIATALLGTSVEIMLVRTGAFSYTHPDIAGVAGWLPWLYTTAAIGVGNLGKYLVETGNPTPATALAGRP